MTRWPRSDLIDLLGITHPILQAPMAGSATPQLAAAVSNAGGLGGLGCAAMDRVQLESAIAAYRANSSQPLNVNFFAHPLPVENAKSLEATRRAVAHFYRELGLELPARTSPVRGSYGAWQHAVMVAAKPQIVSFHFGLPEAHFVTELKRAGVIILSTATTVAEARALEAAGVDAVIAQGFEAGGHRGAFTVADNDIGIGTLSLVPQVVDAVKVPVIATGGIADGRGIAAAFALGASGVQIGTAFLSCPETEASTSHREALAHAQDTDTRLTRAFSGRPARARRNRYLDGMADVSAKLVDFPSMYDFSGPLQKDGGDDFSFLLYGQSAALNRTLPAAELMELLVREAQAILARA